MDGREMFSLTADAALRGEIQKERQRIVQAMLTAKKAARPPSRPRAKRRACGTATPWARKKN
ncbi:hypothetical protein ACFQT0_19805 [Hymenobacter humi]|uniref:Uncharacterized protein n=1 Tax=Hymenobacter humi TaxID=1411620 RepID=A0ABW2UAC2_9BACT